jgi:hypothetical protein
VISGNGAQARGPACGTGGRQTDALFSCFQALLSLLIVDRASLTGDRPVNSRQRPRLWGERVVARKHACSHATHTRHKPRVVTTGTRCQRHVQQACCAEADAIATLLALAKAGESTGDMSNIWQLQASSSSSDMWHEHSTPSWRAPESVVTAVSSHMRQETLATILITRQSVVTAASSHMAAGAGPACAIPIVACLLSSESVSLSKYTRL